MQFFLCTVIDFVNSHDMHTNYCSKSGVNWIHPTVVPVLLPMLQVDNIIELLTNATVELKHAFGYEMAIGSRSHVTALNSGTVVFTARFFDREKYSSIRIRLSLCYPGFPLSASLQYCCLFSIILHTLQYSIDRGFITSTG